jgi:hypothetical protein
MSEEELKEKQRRYKMVNGEWVLKTVLDYYVNPAWVEK